MTDEELDKEWALLKKLEAERDAKWDALPPEEKERRLKMYDDPFYERISDNPLGSGDEGED